VTAGKRQALPNWLISRSWRPKAGSWQLFSG